MFIKYLEDKFVFIATKLPRNFRTYREFFSNQKKNLGDRRKFVRIWQKCLGYIGSFERIEEEKFLGTGRYPGIIFLNSRNNIPELQEKNS